MFEELLEICEMLKEKSNGYWDYIHTKEPDCSEAGIAVVELIDNKVEEMLHAFSEGTMNWNIIGFKFSNGTCRVATGAPLRPTEILYEGKDEQKCIEVFRAELEYELDNLEE